MCYHTEPVRETDQRRAPALSDGDNLLFDEPGRCRPMNLHHDVYGLTFGIQLKP